MCDICHQFFCHPRCPNAPDPPVVYVCSGCDQEIYEGDDYFDILGEQFCENCVRNARRTAVYDPY